MACPDPEYMAEPAKGPPLERDDGRRQKRRRGWFVLLIVILAAGATAGIGVYVSHVYNNPYEDGFSYGASWAGLNGPPHNGFPGCTEYDMARYAHDPHDMYPAWRLGCIEGSDDYFQGFGSSGGTGGTGNTGNSSSAGGLGSTG